MTFTKRVAACLAAAAMLAPPGIASADEIQRNAENIRKLDIMLMVTSLRCRMGADNFQADYRDFSARHLGTLNRAGRQLSADYTRRYGQQAGKRAFDSISVGMANQYGGGHPWLGCADLAEITRELAHVADPAELSEAADYLLASHPQDDMRGGPAMGDYGPADAQRPAIAYDTGF